MHPCGKPKSQSIPLGSFVLPSQANNLNGRTKHGSAATKTPQNNPNSLKEEVWWRWCGGGQRVKQHAPDICRVNAQKKLSWSESQLMAQLTQQTFWTVLDMWSERSNSVLRGCCEKPEWKAWMKTWAWSLDETLFINAQQICFPRCSVFYKSVFFSTPSYDYMHFSRCYYCLKNVYWRV